MKTFFITNTKFGVVLVGCWVSLLSTSLLQAGQVTVTAPQTHIGFGTFGSGDAKLDGQTIDLAQGYSAALGMDYSIHNQLRLGWQASVFKVALESSDNIKQSNPLLSAFLTMSYQIQTSEGRFFISPVASFGYGYLFEYKQSYAQSMYFLETVGTRIGYFITQKFGIAGYANFLWGQGGFGMVRDVSGGPLPMVQLGIVLK